jgi:outer membrane protein W
MRRLPAIGLVALVFGLLVPASAHAQQSLSFYLGGFVPRGEDARAREGKFSNDVLVNNLDFLSFNIKDFSGGTAGAEYLVGLGDWLDAGLGVGIYRRTVPSVYTEFVNANGSEIEQDLRLRIIPFTATVRLLPLGRSSAIQPYIGAGLGVFNWRYSESGSFVDFRDTSIFRDSFIGSGSATGPVILGGLRFPAGAWAIGGEVRYQKAEGDLPLDQDFSADKIDLGGYTYAVTFNVRF